MHRAPKRLKSTKKPFKEDISLNDSEFLIENEQEVTNNLKNESVISTEEKSKIKNKTDQNDSKIAQSNTHQKDTSQNFATHSQKMQALSSWELPESILERYRNRGLTKMFPWQTECLSNPKVLFENKNLVYSAPTSAGKTLVAEILALKTVLERKKKVIIILPFVSVVREKMYYFQDILSMNGIRVAGFMGSYNPPGGFKTVNLAICTIEKANGIINRLLEENMLSEIGAVVIDEMHLLGDPSRGYLLELLLTKLKYMCSKNEGLGIQLIGMSATLPNLNILANWLDAELYTTDFRPIPLKEFSMFSGEIYDNGLKLIRKLQPLPDLKEDTDYLLQICLETISDSCSVLIFCPTKNWCENLAQQIAVAFWKLGRTQTSLGQSLRDQLSVKLITETLEQLQRCPVGLDSVLKKTISFAVAFHHAGLTMDERDIIEGAFKSGSIRVLVATSTLSSGVNLPARRVIIRTPMFHGKPIDTLTYRQMIGRAGRMGKDTAGESVLICQKNDRQVASDLMSAKLEPIESCLEGAGKLKRAILEVIASGVASTVEDVHLFTKCTLLASNQENFENDPIAKAIEFLKENEFIRLQTNDKGELIYAPTSLAKACLSSSMPPEDGLDLFEELEKARRCLCLDTELHLLYLVTPYSVCNQWTNLDWMSFLNMWEKLPASNKRVADLVGVRESFIFNATRGKLTTNSSKMYHKLQIHRRFYTALALQDLVNEVSLNDVAAKFQCSRGMLQSLQQSASTFAGMVTAFSKQLGWTCLEILISQFQDRLQFGIHHELLELMKLPLLNGPRARTLYNADIKTLVDLATTDICKLENILYSAVPFQSEKGREGETAHDVEEKKNLRSFFITGQKGLTANEAAKMLIHDARKYLEDEMGAQVNWELPLDTSTTSYDSYTSSYDTSSSENVPKISSKKISSNKIAQKYSKVIKNKHRRSQHSSKTVIDTSTSEIDEKISKKSKKYQLLVKNSKKLVENSSKSPKPCQDVFKTVSKEKYLVVKNSQKVVKSSHNDVKGLESAHKCNEDDQNVENQSLKNKKQDVIVQNSHNVVQNSPKIAQSGKIETAPSKNLVNKNENFDIHNKQGIVQNSKKIGKNSPSLVKNNQNLVEKSLKGDPKLEMVKNEENNQNPFRSTDNFDSKIEVINSKNLILNVQHSPKNSFVNKENFKNLENQSSPKSSTSFRNSLAIVKNSPRALNDSPKGERVPKNSNGGTNNHKIVQNAQSLVQSGPIKVQKDPNVAQNDPNVVKSVQYAVQSGPNVTRSGPNVVQSCPNLAQTGPNAAQIGPNIAQSGPNVAQSGPNVAQSDPNVIHSDSNVIQNYGVNKIGPTVSKNDLIVVKNSPKSKSKTKLNLESRVSSGYNSLFNDTLNEKLQEITLNFDEVLKDPQKDTQNLSSEKIFCSQVGNTLSKEFQNDVSFESPKHKKANASIVTVTETLQLSSEDIFASDFDEIEPQKSQDLFENEPPINFDNGQDKNGKILAFEAEDLKNVESEDIFEKNSTTKPNFKNQQVFNQNSDTLFKDTLALENLDFSKEADFEHNSKSEDLFEKKPPKNQNIDIPKSSIQNSFRHEENLRETKSKIHFGETNFEFDSKSEELFEKDPFGAPLDSEQAKTDRFVEKRDHFDSNSKNNTFSENDLFEEELKITSQEDFFEDKNFGSDSTQNSNKNGPNVNFETKLGDFFQNEITNFNNENEISNFDKTALFRAKSQDIFGSPKQTEDFKINVKNSSQNDIFESDSDTEMNKTNTGFNKTEYQNINSQDVFESQNDPLNGNFALQKNTEGDLFEDFLSPNCSQNQNSLNNLNLGTILCNDGNFSRTEPKNHNDPNFFDDIFSPSSSKQKSEDREPSISKNPLGPFQTKTVEQVPLTMNLKSDNKIVPSEPFQPKTRESNPNSKSGIKAPTSGKDQFEMDQNKNNKLTSKNGAPLPNYKNKSFKGPSKTETDLHNLIFEPGCSENPKMETTNYDNLKCDWFSFGEDKNLFDIGSNAIKSQNLVFDIKGGPSEYLQLKAKDKDPNSKPSFETPKNTTDVKHFENETGNTIIKSKKSPGSNNKGGFFKGPKITETGLGNTISETGCSKNHKEITNYNDLECDWASFNEDKTKGISPLGFFQGKTVEQNPNSRPSIETSTNGTDSFKMGQNKNNKFTCKKDPHLSDNKGESFDPERPLIPEAECRYPDCEPGSSKHQKDERSKFDDLKCDWSSFGENLVENNFDTCQNINNYVTNVNNDSCDSLFDDSINLDNDSDNVLKNLNLNLEESKKFEKNVMSKVDCTKNKAPKRKNSKVDDCQNPKRNRNEKHRKREIIINDVTNDKNTFLNFSKKLLQNPDLAISLAIEGYTPQKQTIGQKLMNRIHWKENPRSNFTFDDMQLAGISIFWGKEVYYVNLLNQIISNDEKLKVLKCVFCNPKVSIRIFDSKEQLKYFYRLLGLSVECCIFDPKVADWLLEPEDDEKSLISMVVNYTPKNEIIIKNIQDYPRTGSLGLHYGSSIPPFTRAGLEAYLVWYIAGCQVELLTVNEKLSNTFRIEMNTIKCLVQIELNGLGVCREKLSEQLELVKENLESIEKQAYRLAGKKFAIHSSKEVAKVLGLTAKKQSTNKQKLGQLNNPLSDLIISWRKLYHTSSKILAPMLQVAKKNRIYGVCISRTSTGRISMQEPNLQCIPRNFDVCVENELVPISIRSCFVPSLGKTFVSADYCQLELRILAYLAEDPTLCKILRSDGDIFKKIGSKLYNINETDVDDTLRQHVKQVCYGIIYGMGPKSLSEQLGTTEDEAQQFIIRFMQRYPKIKKFMDTVIALCRMHGYVETIGGRRRYLPNICDENSCSKAQAERQAINTTIQGSAADLSKTAMVAIQKVINQNYDSSIIKLVLHLHDEFLYEVDNKYTLNVAMMIKDTMEKSIRLSLPFPVTVKTGKSWGELTVLKTE